MVEGDVAVFVDHIEGAAEQQHRQRRHDGAVPQEGAAGFDLRMRDASEREMVYNPNHVGSTHWANLNVYMWIYS